MSKLQSCGALVMQILIQKQLYEKGEIGLDKTKVEYDANVAVKMVNNT